jgi:F-type H+-transporting ATPase subunit gamma
MSKRREVENHRKQLLEIREIMNSMKNLAYLETRKLSQRLISQQKAVVPIESAAADLIYFYPEIRPIADVLNPIVLIVGSERGFCGDYNELLMEHLRQKEYENSHLVVVGNKLTQRLEFDDRVIASLAGANTVDETGDVINRIFEVLTDSHLQDGGRPLKLVYHDSSTKQILTNNILPSFADLSTGSPSYGCAPDINLSPRDLINELAEHYLFALLYRALYAALMTENLSRIDHMENALQRIDEKAEGLNQQCNVLRQEEIIEEIEIILLNTRLASKRHEKHLLPKHKD